MAEDKKKSKSAAKVEPLRKPVACPNCGKDSARTHYPFCSQRCAGVDLNRWFSGAYAISSQSADDITQEEET